MTKTITRLSSIAAAATLLLSLAAAQLLAQTPPPANGPVAIHGQLSVKDGRIVDKNLEPVQLRGMSLYWSIGSAAKGYYNADVVKYLASDWNASLIRAAMGVEDCWDGRTQSTNTTRPCNTDQAGYLWRPDENRAQVEAVVDGAIQAGIYVIIDWHSHFAHEVTDKAVEFFTYMANKYKEYPNVIYEIYNEPLQVTWSSIKPYMQTVTNAIRAIDPYNIIIIGTPYWCQNVHEATSSPVDGDHLAYAAHFYAGDADNQGNPTPIHTWRLRNRIYEAVNTKKQAVFISEFGSVNAQGKGEHNAEQTDIWLTFMDENKLSYAYWSLSAVNEPASVLRSGASTSPGVNNAQWTDADLTTPGLYMRNKLRSPPNTNSNMFKYLSVTIVPEDGGSIMPKWGSAASAPDAPFIFEEDTVIYLRAGSKPGYRFVRWEGDIEPLTTLLSSELRMDGNKHVTAVFEPTGTTGATLDVTLTDTGRGSTGTGKYAQGARVIISSGVPPAGKKFVRWETTSAGVSFKNAKKGKTEFTMPGNAVTIKAVFE